MDLQQLQCIKRIFAGTAGAPILLAYLVIVLVGRASLPEAVLVLLGFAPLFAPVVVYYFWVTHARAVVVCGMLLVALTVPPWLLVCTGNLQHFSQGVWFLATLVASIVGTYKSQPAAPAV